MQRKRLVVVGLAVVAMAVGANAQVGPAILPAPTAPVASQPTTNGTPPPAMAANPSDVTNPMTSEDPNQIICLKEKVTGSMLPTTVCHTRRSWIQQGVGARNFVEHVQNVGNTPLGGN